MAKTRLELIGSIMSSISLRRVIVNSNMKV